MPEIWLRYGATDVVLDIKFENLSSQISSAFAPMPEEQVNAVIETIPITDNMLIFALSSSKAIAKIITSISQIARTKGFAPVSIDVPAKAANELRSNLAAFSTDPQGIPSINRVEHKNDDNGSRSLEERTKKFQSTLFLSQAGFDPLFGFSGAPTTLVRNLFPEKMAEAFASRKDNKPAPGVVGEPLKIAISSIEEVRGRSIEIVANSAGIAEMHSGSSIQETFLKATEQLVAVATTDADPVRSLVISAGAEPGTHATLASALHSLWNEVHMVRDGGSAVLLAECREGVGGGALQAFIEGRIKPEQIVNNSASNTLIPSPQLQYTDGLEHLLYIQELKQRIELGLVSSLPNYYARTKLGFATYSGAKEALEKLLLRNGKGHKALVVSDADITLVKPRV